MPTAGSVAVIVMNYDGTTMKARSNGAQVGAVVHTFSSLNSLARFRVGSAIATNGTASTGYREAAVAEIVGMTGVSLEVIQAIEGRMLHKRGQQANLNAAHPWATTSPLLLTDAMNG